MQTIACMVMAVIAQRFALHMRGAHLPRPRSFVVDTACGSD